MKRILVIITLILGLTATFGFAQMGGGMMGGHGHEPVKVQPMEHKGMMEHGKMMNDMVDMMQQMSGMMHDIEDNMANMPKEKMLNMSKMMKEMSMHMLDMSKMMEKGMTTDEEMNVMHNNMMEMQKKMSDMEMKK